jgi:hypothetical protein
VDPPPLDARARWLQARPPPLGLKTGAAASGDSPTRPTSHPNARARRHASTQARVHTSTHTRCKRRERRWHRSDASSGSGEGGRGTQITPAAKAMPAAGVAEARELRRQRRSRVKRCQHQQTRGRRRQRKQRQRRRRSQLGRQAGGGGLSRNSGNASNIIMVLHILLAMLSTSNRLRIPFILIGSGIPQLRTSASYRRAHHHTMHPHIHLACTQFINADILRTNLNIFSTIILYNCHCTTAPYGTQHPRPTCSFVDHSH